jgi:tryptophan-rich sensory protein
LVFLPSYAEISDMKNPLRHPRAQLAFWIIAYMAIGSLIGNLTAADVSGWYKTLEKPSFNPPNLAFPIVWTTLYIFMGIAGWRLWSRRHSPEGKLSFTLFCAQSLLNWGWSFVFFTAHLLGLAFGWILVLIALVAVLILKAWDVDRTSALLLFPYLLWISFASVLSGTIWVLN